jgi:hypothetical protein
VRFATKSWKSGVRFELPDLISASALPNEISPVFSNLEISALNQIIFHRINDSRGTTVHVFTLSICTITGFHRSATAVVVILIIHVAALELPIGRQFSHTIGHTINSQNQRSP